MRAVRFTRYGGPEVLEVADVPERHAGPGQVRIRVEAAAVNPYDHKVRAGAMSRGKPLDHPVVTGQEASGVVDEVGDGVTGTQVGDAVFGFAVNGAAAEYAVLHHWARQPVGLGFVESAGLALAAETAERGLRHLDVRPGDTILVHGAAGGVGQAAVQFARLRGATVIGTASAANHDLLRSLGALPTTYEPGLPARVAELAPEGVAGVFDTAGTSLDELIEVAGAPARVVSIANYTAGERGVVVTTGGADSAWDALPRVSELAAQGSYRVRVEAVFPFAEAAAAHRLSESRRAHGKIVLVP